MKFNEAFEQWMHKQIVSEKNGRRRERLEKGLGHGETELLRTVWYPAVGNFDHLYAEWEVRDFSNRYRYLDFAYVPGDAKGGIEVLGYGPHARDIDVGKFKDQCMRHALLALDNWLFLPIAYPSIEDEPKFCQQLVLSFIGKFISTDVHAQLSWLEAETMRFARRMLCPFTPAELSAHLRISGRHTRTILHKLVDLNLLRVVGGHVRARTYMLVF